jgi:8-oxo-dGTP pyrophosphatase MutT (NUDIX family)
MQLPVPLARQGYRVAYLGLRLWWLVANPVVIGVKCALVDGDRVLLVRHSYGPRHWDLPGGTVKRDEQPVQTAQREIAEELGLQIADWKGLGAINDDSDHRRETIHCFQAEVTSPQLVLAPAEIVAARWFLRSELPPRLSRYVRLVLGRATPTR